MSFTISTVPTKIRLSEIHNKLENEFMYGSALYNDAIAKELQGYLQELKNSQRSPDGKWNLIRKEANKLLGRSSNRSLFKESGGDPFEKDLIGLTEALLNVAFNGKTTSADLMETFSDRQNINTTKKINSWAGPMSIKIETKQGDIANFPDAIVKDILHRVGQAQEKIVQNKKGELKISHRNYLDLSAKQGHVDIKGTGASMVIPLELQLGDTFMRLAQILTNYNFSLKNYRSSGYNNLWEEIKIDTTNPYKAYATVLANLGYGISEINSSFERLYYCNYALSVKGNSSHASHGVALHMGHIQSVYGLMGEGLLNPASKDQQVDFIIINDPTSNQIYVESAANLVYQVLRGVSKSVYLDRMSHINIFGSGGVRISGSTLK